MKTVQLASVAAFLGILSVGADAWACKIGAWTPGGNPGNRPKPVVQPVQPVQNVSFQASELLERATQLESAAATHSTRARTAEQNAETLSNRSRILRVQATQAGIAPSDRADLLALADELLVRAADDRAVAASEQASATRLRLQAQSLRSRAIELVRVTPGGGGGGWRRGTSVPTVAGGTSVTDI